MIKTLVLEAMYEAVSESLEWGIDCKDGSHSYFIDGIVAVTERMLEKLEDEGNNSLNNLKEAMKCFGKSAETSSTENAFKESIVTYK